MVTEKQFLEMARERLLGVQVGEPLQREMAAFRADVLGGTGCVLTVHVPEHAHPHVLTDVLLGEGTTPWEVVLIPMYDDCPDGA